MYQITTYLCYFDMFCVRHIYFRTAHDGCAILLIATVVVDYEYIALN